jgi:hypothetical protein
VATCQGREWEILIYSILLCGKSIIESSVSSGVFVLFSEDLHQIKRIAQKYDCCFISLCANIYNFAKVSASNEK